MTTRRPLLALTAVLAAGALLVGACSSSSPREEASGPPVIIATTSILGDIASTIVGDLAEVEVVIPANTDPHDFEASAKEAERLREASVVIANGLMLEEGLLDALDAAESDGVPVLRVGDAVDPLPSEGEAHADEAKAEGAAHFGEASTKGVVKAENAAFTGDDHGHGEDDHGHGEEKHGHGEFDPHFWMDPTRVAIAAEAIADAVVADAGLDRTAVDANTAAFVSEVEKVDADVEATLAVLAPDQRRLVTNHEALGYLADRYDLEIIGTIIPTGSTLAEPSAAALDELAETMRTAGVRAIFTENTTPDDLAATLAAEVGGEVTIVQLFTDSVGSEGSGGATWAEMMRTNAQRIAGALGTSSPTVQTETPAIQ